VGTLIQAAICLSVCLSLSLSLSLCPFHVGETGPDWLIDCLIDEMQWAEMSNMNSPTGWSVADSSRRQRRRVQQVVQVLHDNQAGQPALPAWGLHQGHHHQLHRHQDWARRPAAEVKTFSAAVSSSSNSADLHWFNLLRIVVQLVYLYFPCLHVFCFFKHSTLHFNIIGPILWSHSGPICHALSLLSSSSSLLWTSMHRWRATVATSGEWQCGVRLLTVANGTNIFQMLLVLTYVFI